jgi:hypothetical protein
MRPAERLNIMPKPWLDALVRRLDDIVLRVAGSDHMEMMPLIGQLRLDVREKLAEHGFPEDDAAEIATDLCLEVTHRIGFYEQRMGRA